jgi:hypothetical protein
MALFLPLACLGGLGYAGMLQILPRITFLQGARQKWIGVLLALALFGAVSINFTRYRFSPAECCTFYGPEEAHAMAWMGKNLPPEAKVLIAASEAAVFEHNPSGQYAGSDAGIWITPLIHRQSLPYPYQADFRSEDLHNELCQNGVTHVYIGGKGASFNAAQLNDLPGWYQLQLGLPKNRVYRLAGCP